MVPADGFAPATQFWPIHPRTWGGNNDRAAGWLCGYLQQVPPSTDVLQGEPSTKISLRNTVSGCPINQTNRNPLILWEKWGAMPRSAPEILDSNTRWVVFDSTDERRPGKGDSVRGSDVNLWQLLNEQEKSQPRLSQTRERHDRKMKHEMAKACKSSRLDGSLENMDNLKAPLHKYTEPIGHEMENLMLKHPFNIKYFNNREHYLCYGTSASSTRSQALTVLTKSEHAPYTPGWTLRRNRPFHSKSTRRTLWSKAATDCQEVGDAAGPDGQHPGGPALTNTISEGPSKLTAAGACICWTVNSFNTVYKLGSLPVICWKFCQIPEDVFGLWSWKNLLSSRNQMFNVAAEGWEEQRQ